MTPRSSTSERFPLLAIVGYILVCLLIAAGWKLSDQRLIVAGDGLGYWLGVLGSLMMLVLLAYPVRKRARFLQQTGSIQHWFRLHMILGIAGPVLILFHSNFNLGSINSRIALFCTIVVASSGILGRYFYAKIHHGIYGSRATYDELKAELADRPGSLIDSTSPDAWRQLEAAEQRVEAMQHGVLSSMILAATIGTELRSARNAFHTSQESRESDHVEQHFRQRLRLLRKFAQLRAFERLFSLWHVVHYPLFIVMVVAAIIHVVAVHAY